MTSKQKILEILEKDQTTVADMVNQLGVSRQVVHRLLARLLEDGLVVKIGTPPTVFYSLAESIETSNAASADIRESIDNTTLMLIEDNFLHITPFGSQTPGWDGFVKWCTERNQNIVAKAEEYRETYENYRKYEANGLIDGKKKLNETFAEIGLDEIFYIDFYSYQIFGKTKLGQQLLYAKQGQDRALMNQLIDAIKPKVSKLIESYQIDGVAFAPPTVKREHQLMTQIEQRLNLPIRTLSLVKLRTEIIVPQKTLSKLEHRITNAKSTIAIDDNGSYKNILIVDDAVGSGATLNEIALKIKNKGMCSGKIIGLAVTGSANGFDVISEV